MMFRKLKKLSVLLMFLHVYKKKKMNHYMVKLPDNRETTCIIRLSKLMLCDHC